MKNRIEARKSAAGRWRFSIYLNDAEGKRYTAATSPKGYPTKAEALRVAAEASGVSHDLSSMKKMEEAYEENLKEVRRQITGWRFVSIVALPVGLIVGALFLHDLLSPVL